MELSRSDVHMLTQREMFLQDDPWRGTSAQSTYSTAEPRVTGSRSHTGLYRLNTQTEQAYLMYMCPLQGLTQNKYMTANVYFYYVFSHTS